MGFVAVFSSKLFGFFGQFSAFRSIFFRLLDAGFFSAVLSHILGCQGVGCREQVILLPTASYCLIIN